MEGICVNLFAVRCVWLLHVDLCPVFALRHSAGLFPLLSNAAMSVKPALLGLYETYYLPLGKTLKPGLQGLLSGGVPGLEGGSECYDR